MSLDPYGFELLTQGAAVSLTVVLALAIAVMHRAHGSASSATLLLYTVVWLLISLARFASLWPTPVPGISAVTVGTTLLLSALGGLLPVLTYRFVTGLGHEAERPLPWREGLAAALASLLVFGTAVALLVRSGDIASASVVRVGQLAQASLAATALLVVVRWGKWRGPHHVALWFLSASLVVLTARPFIAPGLTAVLERAVEEPLVAQIVVLAASSGLVALVALLTYGTLLVVTQSGLREAEEWILRAERGIHTSRAAQDQGRLAAGLAHDVGNVLHVITLVASQLEGRVRAEDWVRLTTLAERGRMLVHRMLDVARSVPTELRDTNVGECVQRLLPVLLRLAPAHALELRVADTPVLARVDPEALERILMELVRHAADTTPRASRISIAVERTAFEGSPVLAAGEFASVSVEDEGAGIPREHLPDPTDADAATATPDTALGLSTYRGLARSMGGDLVIAKSDASGSVLRLWMRPVSA